MNWCGRAQLSATKDLYDRHLEVGVHEVLHALGFSAGLWRRQHRRQDLSYFLKPDASGYVPYAGVNAVPWHCRSWCSKPWLHHSGAFSPRARTAC